MSRHIFKLPDLGEGIVSSEVVAWRVAPGDLIREDDPLVEMSTDKAVVEVPSPVTGRIVSLGGKPGDVIAVGGELAVLDTEVSGASAAGGNKGAPAAAAQSAPATQKPAANAGAGNGAALTESKPGGTASASSSRGASGAQQTSNSHVDAGGTRIKASPSTRRRAKDAGIDLTLISGTGPGGRIRREDLDSALQGGGPRIAAVSGAQGASARAAGPQARAPQSSDAGDEIREKIPVVGVRRIIAQRMAEAKRTIPHFSYVEEVDVTELESLRSHLNSKQRGGQALTYLPFIVIAMVRAIEEFPQVNARYDAANETVLRLRPVHIGIATQTPDGLKVPVVRNAEQRGVRELAAEIVRVSEAARTNRAKREELSGSTITLTSLGKLGGIVTTPIVNSPEVAIVGVNRAVERPMVVDGQIAIRRMMNLSSSFDHRFVDGYDAAAFIQAVKARLEHPALLFAEI